MEIFWLIGITFALRNFLTLTTTGGLIRFFEKIVIYWFLEGSGHLEKFRAPTAKKMKKTLKFSFFIAVSKNVFSSKTEQFFFRFQAQKKSENVLKSLFFVAVSKDVFSSETEGFSQTFFLFRPLVPPIGAVRTENRFQAQNGPPILKKWIFPALGAVLGETPAEQI